MGSQPGCSSISLGAISKELGLGPTPSPALVLSQGAGTLLWALRGKSSPRGVGRGRWGLRRAQAQAIETKDRSDKSHVGKPICAGPRSERAGMGAVSWLLL